MRDIIFIAVDFHPDMYYEPALNRMNECIDIPNFLLVKGVPVVRRRPPLRQSPIPV